MSQTKNKKREEEEEEKEKKNKVKTRKLRRHYSLKVKCSSYFSVPWLKINITCIMLTSKQIKPL